MVKQAPPKAKWKDALVNASHALAHLDADRLEEMALSCSALVREEHEVPFDTRGHSEPGHEEPGFGEAAREMANFARILEATRVNLNVMRRIRDARATQLEYGRARGLCDVSVEGEHGDH
jgi:hypothetical protein